MESVEAILATHLEDLDKVKFIEAIIAETTFNFHKGCIINKIDDHLYYLEYTTPTYKVTHKFKLVDGKFQSHGIWDTKYISGKYIAKIYENGVLVKRLEYINNKLRIFEYNADGSVIKDVVTDFSDFPDGDKILTSEESLSHFKQWLKCEINRRSMGTPGTRRIFLNNYGLYLQHLPWLENFARFKKYTITESPGFHYLWW